MSVLKSDGTPDYKVADLSLAEAAEATALGGQRRDRRILHRRGGFASRLAVSRVVAHAHG